jgi:hypothetical protein
MLPAAYARRVDDTDIGSVPRWKGRSMKRVAVVLAGAMAFLTTIVGTAFAQTTEAPAPTNVVEGAGGGAAFTGGDTATAAFVAVALVTVGLVALLVARHHTSAAS